MADHIPFITSEDSCKLVTTLYPDSATVRAPLDRIARLVPHLPRNAKLWLDLTVDGIGEYSTRTKKWIEFIEQFPFAKSVGDASFQAKPIVREVEQFVNAVLGHALQFKPSWISVPQLPLVNGVGRNKINRALAAATGKWRANQQDHSAKLILPLVLTHQDQANGKTSRNQKIKEAEHCYNSAGANGVWVVEKSLCDDSGSKTLRNVRVPAIIAFHEELNERISSTIRIAGPYWGLNLVLWARGLVDFPAIGVGWGYQYHLSGGQASTPSARIALGPLRRRAVAGQLRKWLDDVLRALATSHPAHAEFAQLRGQLTMLSHGATARDQVAKFYKRWFDSIAAQPAPGRSMALFQDLSSAFALGRGLPELDDEGTARRPEAVVEPLMLNCL